MLYNKVKWTSPLPLYAKVKNSMVPSKTSPLALYAKVENSKLNFSLAYIHQGQEQYGS